MTQLSFGGFVRHRDRMVQESVLEDLQNTLIACRWMAGTTSRPVVSPYAPGDGWQIVTTTTNQVLKIVGKRDDGSVAQAVIIDYFPNTDQNDPEGGSPKTELNTLAVDTGVAQTPVLMELGSNLKEQQYAFTMVLYASSDAVALAMMNDLRDRYEGRMVSDDNLNLYNYNADDFDVDTPPVTRMEIDSFRYDQNADTVAPYEVHLYFAELVLTDYVDPGQAYVPSEDPDEPGLDFEFREIAVGDDPMTYEVGVDQLFTYESANGMLVPNDDEPDGRWAVRVVPELEDGQYYESDGQLRYAFTYNETFTENNPDFVVGGIVTLPVDNPANEAMIQAIIDSQVGGGFVYVGTILFAFTDEEVRVDIDPDPS